MDYVVKQINGKCENKIKIGNKVLRNTIAYADDLAIIVKDMNDLRTVFKEYEEFSKISGLYLNADKTEILRLKTRELETIPINIYGESFQIKTVDRIKICGKTYAMDPNIEHEENITKQITKLKGQLKMWEKRNLSTDGRILVAKTFGISQIIYQMQNTFLNKTTIKEIESLVYKYIWKGPDKIKRSIIQMDYKDGGLKGPNIEALDKTLKLKQVLRASGSNHDINIAQRIGNIIGKYAISNKVIDSFIRKGVDAANEIGEQILNQILTDPQGNIHKSHFVMLGNLPLIDFSKAVRKDNPIYNLNLKKEMNDSEIRNVRGLCSMNVDTHQAIKSLKEAIPEDIIQKIANWTYLERDDTVMRLGNTNVAIKLNIFREVRSIKHREVYLSSEDKESNEVNPFTITRKIMHPRERMIQFMDLHSKTYTNEKLARLKITNNEKCHTCPTMTETRDHLYINCKRAREAWKIYEEVTGEQINDILIKNGPIEIQNLNIFSLVKFNIVCARDKPINTITLKIKCENRIKDIEQCKRNRKFELNNQKTLRTLFKKFKPQIRYTIVN